ncbi:MAG: DUF6273 domain-containing protein [Acutalibacteraceae bacterium]
MKRIFKRTIAVVVTLLMLLTSVPIAALAVGGGNDGALDTKTYVKGASSVGNMLAETLENAQNEYENNLESEAYISSLNVDGFTAEVKFLTQKDAKIVVAVYTEDDGKMLTSGIVNVTTEDESAFVEINEVSLPQYYIVKAFLVDANTLAALCSPYVDNTHTQAYIEFMSKDVNDFENDKVINLDNNEENNFLVVADDAEKVVGTSSTNVLVSADYDNGIYEFSDIDDSLKNLKPGDVFYFRGLDGIDEVIKVKTIDIDGTKATIVSDVFELEDAFDYIKIDSSEIQRELSAQSAGQQKAKKIEQEASLEFFDASFEIKYKEKENGTRGFQIIHHINKEGLEVKDTPDSEKDWNDDDLKVLASVKADVNLKVDFKIYIAKKYKEISFTVSGEAGVTLEVGTEFEHTFKLGKFEATFFKIISVGAAIGIKVDLKIVATVSGTLTFRQGVEVKNGDWNIINEKPEFKPEVKVEGELFIGIELKPYLNLIDGHIVNIETPLTVGPKVTATLSSEVLTDPNHDCNACISGDIKVELEIKADVWICNKKHNSEERHWELGKYTTSWFITDFYYSITHNKFGWGKCPYIKAKDDPNTGNGGLTGGEKTGDIIKFGSYPQSRVTDEVLLDGLNSQSLSWKSYEYYSGTGSLSDGQMKSSDYMKYADIVFNGNKYRAVTFSEFRPIYTGYTSAGETYQDDNGYYVDNVYYFKYEPLEWRVLDASEGLVMCNTIIDSQAYNNFTISDGSTCYYGDAEKTYYASDYANSSIRKWLNEDFYNTAFSASQQSKIKKTHLENKSSYESKYDSADTDDKIYLLSYWDVLNSSYGFSSSYSTNDTARLLKGTEYAKCQGLLTFSNGNSGWRLRSPMYYDFDAYVDNYGHTYGTYGYGGVSYTSRGVVPALRLEKSTISTASMETAEIISDTENETVTTGVALSGTKVDVNFASGKASFGGVSGNRYMLYSVKNLGETLTVTEENLTYINQATGDTDGTVTAGFYPTDFTTLVIVGDFGSGIEARRINLTFELKNGAKAEVLDGLTYITGLRPGLAEASFESEYLEAENVSVKMNKSTSSNIGTGTTLVVTSEIDGSVVGKYTVLIYGDIDGDGWYDGQDAITVSCLANGMLTREQVGEAIWMAADCNHDGVIDQLDVDLLNQAGVLLSSVDQTKPTEELLETSAEYNEYLSLIDQMGGEDAAETPTQDENDSFFTRIIAFVESIIKLINTIFTKIF